VIAAHPVQFLLYLLAFVLLVAAAFPVPTRVGLGWLGLACWLAAAVFVPLLGG
jgi:NADH:ubiquinone oxidoreductase subunit 3 (subunit A)